MTDQSDGGTSENEPAVPPPPPSSTSPTAKASWYENVAIVVLALFCCSPLGLVLVWINKKWTTKTKLIITGAFVALALVGAIIGATSSGGSSSDTEPKASVTTLAKDSPSTTAKQSTSTTAKAVAACKDTPDETTLETKKQGLYANRLGISKDDHEAAVGDCVRIDGMTAYVTGARVVTPSFGDKVIVVNVKIRGRDGTKTYNPFDFKLQNPAGSQESITISIDDSINELNAGTLVKGGEVAGDLVFKYTGAGTYYVVWQPNMIKSDKGIWAIEVP